MEHETRSGTEEAEGPRNTALLRWFCVAMVLASMSVSTARLMEARPLASANDRSRWCTIWSLVERGTYQIDEIRQRPGWDTIDKVRHEGHFYSTKPPLLPRMVSELYRVIRATLGWRLDRDLAATTRLLLFIVNILPMTIALALLCQIILRYCESTFGQVLLVTTACWGTLLLPFLTTLNNHTVATTSIVFALAAAISILVERRESSIAFALCGLFAAFGCCNELPAASLGVALFGLLCWRSPRKTLMAFVPASLLVLGAFFYFNYQATGTWKPFYLYYGTEKYEFVDAGIPSYWMEPKGVDKAIDCPGMYFLHCTIGHHGVLSLSPIFLFTAFSWLSVRVWWRSRLRDFHALGIALTAVVFTFYMLKTGNYNYGGVSVALRWMLWLVPFWILAIIPFVNRYGGWIGWRALSIPLLAVSIFSAWYPPSGPWTQPWLFKLMEQAGWIDYSDPRPRFEETFHAWIRTLPTGERQEDYWVAYSTAAEEGTAREMILADGGPVDVDGRSARKLEVRWKRDGRDDRVETYHVDVAAFERGAAVSGLLLWPDGEPSAEEQAAAERFWHGVPGTRPYYSSRIRYLRTSARRDAFRCHIGYSYGTHEDAEGSRLQSTRDAWFCDEIPFGIARWDQRVRDLGSRQTVLTQNWQIVRSGRFIDRANAEATGDE